MATALASPYLPARPSRSPASRPRISRRARQRPSRRPDRYQPARARAGQRSSGAGRAQRRGHGRYQFHGPHDFYGPHDAAAHPGGAPRHLTRPRAAPRPCATRGTGPGSRSPPSLTAPSVSAPAIGRPALLTAKRREGLGRYMLERPGESGHPEPMTGKRLPPVSARLPATPIRQTLAACGSRTPSTSHSVTAYPPLDAP